MRDNFLSFYLTLSFSSSASSLTLCYLSAVGGRQHGGGRSGAAPADCLGQRMVGATLSSLTLFYSFSLSPPLISLLGLMGDQRWPATDDGRRGRTTRHGDVDQTGGDRWPWRVDNYEQHHQHLHHYPITSLSHSLEGDR